jgi:hypothetical protein
MVPNITNLNEYNISSKKDIRESIDLSKNSPFVGNNATYIYNLKELSKSIYFSKIIENLPLFTTDDCLTTVSLDDKYKYRPQYLCHEYYGCSDLWQLILRINNCFKITEFDMTDVKIFNLLGIKKLLDIALSQKETTIQDI